MRYFMIVEMNEKYAEAINNSTRALSYEPTALNYQQRGILYFKSMGILQSFRCPKVQTPLEQK